MLTAHVEHEISSDARLAPLGHTGVTQVRLIERLFPGSSKVELSKMHSSDSGETSLVLKSETFDGHGKADEPTVVMIKTADQLSVEIERIANVGSIIGGDNAARVMRGPEIIGADGRSLSSEHNEEDVEPTLTDADSDTFSQTYSRRASRESLTVSQDERFSRPSSRRASKEDMLQQEEPPRGRDSKESRVSTESMGESADKFPVLGSGLVTCPAITTALGGENAVGAIVVEMAGACWSMPEFQAKMLEGVEVRRATSDLPRSPCLT